MDVPLVLSGDTSTSARGPGRAAPLTSPNGQGGRQSESAITPLPGDLSVRGVSDYTLGPDPDP
jgi:hypothetical protein